MTNYLRLFAEWVTRLKASAFSKARISLTFYYIIAMALIMGIFSVLLYFSLTENIQGDLRDQFYDETIEQEVYSQTVDHVFDVIIGTDIALLALFGLMSYFLASTTLRPIQRALEDQKNFSADASHELRTPLAIIQSEAEIVLRKKSATATEYKKVIQSSLEEVTNMKEIIEDLLLMARSAHKTSKDSYARVNLSELTEAVSSKMQVVAEVKGLSLIQKLEEGVVVLGSTYFLGHALTNILGNAIKYTDTGSVSVEMHTKNKKVYIKISDTGVGIHKKDLPHIFDRFYKASSGAHNKEGGTGLGLAIAHKIITEHGGTIEVESIIEKGTTITVGLPLSI
jgi:signal transduction histidine kinase